MNPSRSIRFPAAFAALLLASMPVLAHHASHQAPEQGIRYTAPAPVQESPAKPAVPDSTRNGTAVPQSAPKEDPRSAPTPARPR